MISTNRYFRQIDTYSKMVKNSTLFLIIFVSAVRNADAFFGQARKKNLEAKGVTKTVVFTLKETTQHTPEIKNTPLSENIVVDDSSRISRHTEHAEDVQIRENHHNKKLKSRLESHETTKNAENTENNGHLKNKHLKIIKEEIAVSESINAEIDVNVQKDQPRHKSEQSKSTRRTTIKSKRRKPMTRLERIKHFSKKYKPYYENKKAATNVDSVSSSSNTMFSENLVDVDRNIIDRRLNDAAANKVLDNVKEHAGEGMPEVIEMSLGNEGNAKKVTNKRTLVKNTPQVQIKHTNKKQADSSKTPSAICRVTLPTGRTCTKTSQTLSKFIKQIKTPTQHIQSLSGQTDIILNSDKFNTARLLKSFSDIQTLTDQQIKTDQYLTQVRSTIETQGNNHQALIHHYEKMRSAAGKTESDLQIIQRV